MAEPVYVWRIDLRLEQGTWMLSPEERRRANALVRFAHRERFERAHAAVRVILSSFLGVNPGAVPIGRRPGGKPFLAGGIPSFSSSRSGDLAVVAVARDREVGVDVERLAPKLEIEIETARRFLSDEELEVLEGRSADGLVLYRAWTRKEAFLKATGRGVSSLRDVDVSLGESASILATRPDPSERDRWELVDLDVGGGWVAALSASRTGSPLEIRTIEFGCLVADRTLRPGRGMTEKRGTATVAVEPRLGVGTDL